MAFVVYLGAMAVAGFLIVQQVTSGWERSIRGSTTVQLPSAGRGAGTDGKVSLALDILRVTPGVASAKPVSDDEKFALKLAPAHSALVSVVLVILAALTLIRVRVTVHRFLAARS